MQGKISICFIFLCASEIRLREWVSCAGIYCKEVPEGENLLKILLSSCCCACVDKMAWRSMILG